METDSSIYFYGVNDEYGYMSNFYKSNFNSQINNKLIQFNCSEQYFMYKKAITFDKDNTDNVVGTYVVKLISISIPLVKLETKLEE